VKDLLKRILPQPVQRAIYRFLWNPVRDAYWRALKLNSVLPSGLHIQIRNRSDWTIFSEVLIAGEYDIPIDWALQRHPRGQPFRVADFGGNVGYFTFRCADRFLHQNQGTDTIQILVVEGSPTIFPELERRIAREPLLRDNVKLRFGLVGQKSGDAFISGHHIHYANMVSEKPSPGATRVPFVDLDTEFAGVDRIDLLKCDIEGAEFDFIGNFPDFLRKVDVAVFEFHRYGRNIDEARQVLHTCGFCHRRVLRDTPAICVEYYWR
jgi:FkbM family methyltransferase